MLDKFLVLLERFVVAHELIAANSSKTTLIEKVGDVVRAEETVAEPEQKAHAKRGRPAKQKAEPEQEEEEVQKTKAKAKAEGAPDLDTLRDEIKTIATHIAEGDSDDCADEFEDLLEDFKVRSVTKLADDDVEGFHAEAKNIISKYYDVED